MRVDIVNRSGFALARTASAPRTRSTSSTRRSRPTTIADKGSPPSSPRSKGEDATGPAGDVDYIVGRRPRATSSSSMNWRHGASPVGKAKPNDGRFVVQAMQEGRGPLPVRRRAGQGQAGEADPGADADPDRQFLGHDAVARQVRASTTPSRSSTPSRRRRSRAADKKAQLHGGLARTPSSRRSAASPTTGSAVEPPRDRAATRAASTR